MTNKPILYGTGAFFITLMVTVTYLIPVVAAWFYTLVFGLLILYAIKKEAGK